MSETKQKERSNFSKVAAASALTGAAFMTTTAMAAPVDVTAIVSDIEGNAASVITVGGAILGIIVIVVMFSMVRRMIR